MGETQALFSPNYLNVSSSDKSKIFTSTEQTSCIDRIIAALKNKCSIKKCDFHSDHLKKLSSNTDIENNNCSCRLLGDFKLKRMFLKDEPKANMNSIVVTINEFDNSTVIEDSIRDQIYIVKDGIPPSTFQK